MKKILDTLIQEYQRLMEIEAKYEEWKNQNPDESPWKYKGQRVSRARFERLGIMIRQTMIDYEKNHNIYD